MNIDYGKHCDVSELVGKTLVAIEGGAVGSEEITFVTDTGERFGMYYDHDCCASCEIEDVNGDWSDLIGSPITEASERSSSKKTDWPADAEPMGEYVDSFTWTFYHFATAKGTVVLRWYGESNGYYSESTTFGRLT